MSKTTLSSLLVTILALIVIGCTLTFAYEALGLYLHSVAIAAAIINLILGGLLIYRLPAAIRDNAFRIPPFRTLLPGIFVLAGTLLLALTSNYLSPSAQIIDAPPQQWLFILVVPFAEEIFFRGSIGSILRMKLGKFSGCYISVLFFAWMHSLPSFSQIFNSAPQMYLGPLILGGMCEALFVWSGGSLIPGIILHMISNATVPLFALIDARWLEWLGILYL